MKVDLSNSSKSEMKVLIRLILYIYLLVVCVLEIVWPEDSFLESSVLFPYGFQGLNSDCQDSGQALLPAQMSCLRLISEDSFLAYR